MAFNPADPNYLLNGSDGGLYESWDLGETWKYVANLPVTQFYKVAVDYDEPFYNIYGGTQDNNTQGGPSRTMNVNGIQNSDWFITLFADGHQPAVDPTNPDIVYSEWQQGNPVRYDRKTGEIVYIQPQGEPGDPPDRFNWDTPILISPHDPARLYYASQRIFRSDDRGDSWRPISGDLSRGLDRFTMPMMGRVWSYDAVWDLGAMSFFGNVTSLSESPLVEGLIYAGTDDGLIQVTEDGGETWRTAGSLPGVPEMAFVNDIKADLHDADVVRVALDHHKTGDFSPYLLESSDRGRTWRSIAGDLPERHLVWRLVQDHEKPELLFVGTEFGVFTSLDGGDKWLKLAGGVPNIPFRDLAIQTRENDLVGATFGRGFYVLDDYTPLRHVSEEALEAEAMLFPVKDADWYIPRRPLGRGEKATQGHAYFTAPNPPFGAVFTYYLKDSLETREQKRKKAEKEAAAEGGDTPYPGWEELRVESLEEKPSVTLVVRDAEGEIVRRVAGMPKAGIHRIAWDLRYPTTRAFGRGGGFPGRGGGDSGFLVAPGTYTVSLEQRHDGVTQQLAGPESFEVVRLTQGTLPGAEPEAIVAFLEEIGELFSAVTAAESIVEEHGGQLAAMREVLGRSRIDSAGFLDEIRALELRLAEVERALEGDELRDDIGEPVSRSISGRLQAASLSNRNTTYGPTPTHRRSYEIARDDMVRVRTELGEIKAAIDAIGARLDAAGLPWTPGRDLPGS